MNRIKVLYIVGLGHSGSTLLDLTLSQLPGLTSVGEIINFENFINLNKQCTCGEKISNCKLWSKVLDNYIDKNDLKIHVAKNPTSIEYLKLMLFPIKRHLFRPVEIKDYGLKNHKLFNAILSETENNMIVDSSKDWQRLYLLQKSNLFDIKVIYLFRNGKANLESNKRKALDKNRPDWHYPGPFNQSMKFIKTTLLIRRVLKLNFNKRQIFGLSYEEFSNNPEYALNNILQFINVKESYSKISCSNNQNHNIGGNRMRFQPINEIKLIEKWRKNLSFKEKLIFKLLGGELINKLFKYHKYQNSSNL